MQVCPICTAQVDDDGCLTVEYDRKRGFKASNRDLHYTRSCQYGIARGKTGCLNLEGKVLERAIFS